MHNVDGTIDMPFFAISLLFSIGIALLPIQAMYWSEALGALSASPGLLFILMAVLLSPLAPTRHRPIFHKLKLKLLLLMPVGASVISVAVFGFSSLLAFKFLSVGVLSLLWLSPLVLADHLIIRHVRLAALIGINICLLGYVFSDILDALPSYAQDLLFGVEFRETNDGRPRGFSEEASQFSSTFSRLLILYFLIWESTRRCNSGRLIFFLCCLAVLLVILGSKGAVIGIVFSLLSCTMGRRQLPYLLLALPMVWWLANTQLEAIYIDIEQYSSASTRIILMFTGIVATLVNPFGWGFYGFYGAIQTFGAWTLECIGERFPVLRLLEARDIIDQLNNVSTKTTPLDFTMTFGWMFIWLVVHIIQSTCFDDPRVRTCSIYVMVTSFSTSGHLSIMAFLIFAVILRLYPRSDRAV